MRLRNSVFKWKDKWFETKQVFPNFRTRTEVCEDRIIPRSVDVDDKDKFFYNEKQGAHPLSIIHRSRFGGGF